MEPKPKGKKKSVSPAQPQTAAPSNPTESKSIPLVFIQSGKVIGITEADALAHSQAEAKARREEYLKSQRLMRKQPKHIQALGRTLWNHAHFDHSSNSSWNYQSSRTKYRRQFV